MTLTVSKVLILLAVIFFAIAAFGIGSLGPVSTVPLGLAFFAAGFLVP